MAALIVILLGGLAVVPTDVVMAGDKDDQDQGEPTSGGPGGGPGGQEEPKEKGEPKAGGPGGGSGRKEKE